MEQFDIIFQHSSLLCLMKKKKKDWYPCLLYPIRAENFRKRRSWQQFWYQNRESCENWLQILALFLRAWFMLLSQAS